MEDKTVYPSSVAVGGIDGLGVGSSSSVLFPVGGGGSYVPLPSSILDGDGGGSPVSVYWSGAGGGGADGCRMSQAGVPGSGWRRSAAPRAVSPPKTLIVVK